MMKKMLSSLFIGLLLCIGPLYARIPQRMAAIPDAPAVAEAFAVFQPDYAAAVNSRAGMTAEDARPLRSSTATAFSDAAGLLGRFMFNLLVCWIIVQFFYYRKSRRRDYYFTFILFSSAMFLLLFVMNNLSLQIGFTLGLFAIFGMIRYRTESIPIREMTYLFIIIALSIINGIGAEIPFVQTATANVAVVAVIAVLEMRRVLPERTSSKLIIYDRIELIVPERREELLADLIRRTGLPVISVETGRIDFLKDAAWLKVTYRLTPGESNTMDSLDRIGDFKA